MVYGGTVPAIDYTLKGFQNSDPQTVVSGTASCSTSATSASGVGTYPTNCSVGSLNAANYTFSFQPGTLQVTPATLTVQGTTSKVYGAPVPVIPYQITGFVNGDPQTVVSGSASCTTTAVASSQVASYPINCTGSLSAANYTFSYVQGTLNVTPAPLTVQAASPFKLYGAAVPTIGYNLVGLVNGDSSSVVSGSATCSTTAVASSPPGQYPTTCTGTLAASNYTITYAHGTLTVGFSAPCITSNTSGSLTVGAGQAYCVQTGGTVNGSLTVQAGGSLWLNGGRLKGGLISSGAKVISLCGLSIATGGLTISGSTGPVSVGGTACASNKIVGSVSITKNTGGVIYVRNAVNGSVTITGNSGGFTYNSDTATGGSTITNNK
jgi:hypothetical protein